MRKHPLVIVACACGAEWRGWHAIGNSVIVDHIKRPGCRLRVQTTGVSDTEVMQKRRSDRGGRHA